MTQILDHNIYFQTYQSSVWHLGLALGPQDTIHPHPESNQGQRGQQTLQ